MKPLFKPHKQPFQTDFMLYQRKPGLFSFPHTVQMSRNDIITHRTTSVLSESSVHDFVSGELSRRGRPTMINVGVLVH